jgi:hypothetical protein
LVQARKCDFRLLVILREGEPAFLNGHRFYALTVQAMNLTREKDRKTPTQYLCRSKDMKAELSGQDSTPTSECASDCS